MREVVDALLRRLNAGDDLGEIRLDIADLIEAKPHEVRPSLGYWEKTRLANAITTLAWNT
jgi:hypothetical protein